MNPSPSDLVTVLGEEVPRAIGPFISEYRAIREGVALFPDRWNTSLRVTGSDAPRFLQSLLTQDVLNLDVGQSLPAALASRKGHLEADIQIARCDENGYQIRLQKERLAEFEETLDRYRIVEDVSWSVSSEPSDSFLLVGPNALREVARLVGEDVDALPRAGFLDRFGEGALWWRVAEVSPGDVFVTLPASSSASLIRHFCDETSVAREVGWDAFNTARIEFGRAWFGIDSSSERLVPEAGLEDCISYNKGCYLGQETLARLHYRGQANWKLCKLEWELPADPLSPERDEPAVGDDLFSETRRVGWLTSKATRPDGVRIALGYLHRKYRESGGELQTASGFLVSSSSALTCGVSSTNLSVDMDTSHPRTDGEGSA